VCAVIDPQSFTAVERFSDCIEKILLVQIHQPIVIFVDEMDNLPPTSGNEPDQLCTPSRPKHTAKLRFL